MVVRPIYVAGLAMALFGCARAPAPTRVAMYPAYPLPSYANAPAPASVALETAAPPQRQAAAPVEPSDGAVPSTPAATAPPPPQHPFHQPLPELVVSQAPASRFANMSPTECRAELKRRQLPVKPRKGAASGVAVPLRLDGPIGGVRFVTAPPPTPYGVVDCRIVLVLDELAPLLREHGVATVRVDNVYRPHAHLPGRRKNSQHAHALALDIVSLTLDDGRTLSVENDFGAAIGAAVCGPDAAMDPMTDNAVALRNIVCSVAARGLFHTMLTPAYNAAHRNHFHFDIKRDGKRLGLH